MATIESILSRCKTACDCPSKAISEYTQRTGKGAVGCFPPYCPEEIVHAAGMLPVGVWGGTVELNLVRAHLPAFACSILQSIKEYELSVAYDALSAVIVPIPCDSLKAIGQKWTREKVPCIQFVPPQNRPLEASRMYLRAEYLHIRESLEKIIGGAIGEEALTRSVEIYNEHRHVMRAFSEVAAMYPDIIDPVSRHMVYKSAFFMLKEDHTALVKELMGLLMQQPVKPWDGVKAIVSGIMLEPVSLLEVFRDLRVAIVGDDLAQCSHQYRVDAPAGRDTLDRLSGLWQNLYGCSLAYEKEKLRVPMLRAMKNQRGADGVIVGMMKFCDPEEFDYPFIKKGMEQYGIPLLQVEVDLQAQSQEQIRTRLQSFVEMIGQASGKM